MPEITLAPIELNPDAIAKRIHADRRSVERLTASAADAMPARAAYQVSYVENKATDAVVIGGVRFASRVLRRNLDDVSRVFPFVITLGTVMDATIDKTQSILDKYILDEIANAALRQARRAFEHYLRRQYAVGNVSCMTPGSLEDWPIEQQQALFSLLGGEPEAICVRLTESFLMIPRKSISGIYFPSETTFLSCQLCPREGCDHRKAPYSRAKARDYGIEAASDS